jgi:hypothetical protein
MPSFLCICCACCPAVRCCASVVVAPSTGASSSNLTSPVQQTHPCHQEHQKCAKQWVSGVPVLSCAEVCRGQLQSVCLVLQVCWSTATAALDPVHGLLSATQFHAHVLQLLTGSIVLRRCPSDRPVLATGNIPVAALACLLRSLVAGAVMHHKHVS